MLTTDGSLPQQLGVVWSRLLEADSEGPSFISHAACARSVSSSRTFLSCACGAPSIAQRRPSTLTSVSIGVPARHQVEKKASSPSVRLRRIRSPRVQVPIRVGLNSSATRSASSRYVQSYSRGPLVPSPADRRTHAEGSRPRAIASAVPATSGLPIQELKGCVALTPSTYPLPDWRSAISTSPVP